ncbi:FAD-linked oxidoreductase [Murinocardiopsis flavida]|uniref:FAD-linked oxidoreductase n=1 Tax=Murinocardiopsis flavida TaxID=645275 RepID=A0A2P8CH28_9ACTN|nr:D-arabinono-1,4-lactone oxidase [Murinocardiopsis flavida]PSK84212.1 FAD-linked oxidoreductase [Murinocardiopsis flavida]
MTNVLWRNWAGTETAAPRRTVAPNSGADISAAVRTAAADGLHVRMVGTGHSFTGVAVTDGVLLSPASLTRIRSVDAGTGTATVEAGLPLCDFNEAMAARGLALANMGDIAVQTMAGAVQTGTHGTGRDRGGLAAQVRGMELVLADGSTVACSADADAELFQAARVGLGAFGVVTALTMAVEPAYLLHAREEPMALDEVLDRLAELRSDNEHFEFFWFPHTGRTNTKRNNRVAGPAAPLSPFKRRLDDEFLSNTVFDVVNRVGRRVPAAIPAINQVSARALSARSYTDASYEVFASTRRVRFVEMEYAIPAAELPAVLREVRRIVRRGGHRISFPVEVRFSPADDVWLSTAYGRETAYVAAHVYTGSDHRAYFADLEAVFASVGGRPHWGKLHTRGRDYLERVYPRLGDALAVRDRVDPHRRFGNPYLASVLGD